MDTPLYKITYKINDKISYFYVKDEGKNISGSIKYRPALNMVNKAYEEGKLDKDTPIVEVTSGNMGIALATVANNKGNKVIIYMPYFMSEERKMMIKDLGAELILVNSFDEAFKLASKRKDCFYMRQFENPHNPEGYMPFVKEVEEKISVFPAFISGVGTAGTLMGVGEVLKRKYGTKIIALEPKESLILSTGVSHGEHEIQGLSDGLVPKIYKKQLVDNIYSISSNDSIAMAQKLIKTFNLDVGISSGINTLGSIISNIPGALTVFPDSSDRYHSTKLFKDDLKSELVDSITLLKLEII